MPCVGRQGTIPAKPHLQFHCFMEVNLWRMLAHPAPARRNRNADYEPSHAVMETATRRRFDGFISDCDDLRGAVMMLPRLRQALLLGLPYNLPPVARH